MKQEDIIKEVQKLLELHFLGTLGYMGQEPYKGDFFKLFKEAYQAGFCDTSSNQTLTGDAFRSILVARWFSGDKNDDAKKEKLLDQLFSMWDEWRYAWDNY